MTAFDYLVVAPPAGDMPFVFPLGMIDLVHRLGRPAHGVYARQLTASLARQASVAVLPLHWYYSLGPGIEIARQLKRWNSRLRIVTGGYTASAFADQVLASGPFDFVVRGDAETPFVALMRALLDGGDTSAIPNLAWSGGGTSLSYCVDPPTLAASHNRDVSWFPAFERAALASQQLRDPAMLFPWVVVSRGCCFDCAECYASTSAQQVLAGRGLVVRPPEAVCDDLKYWSARQDIRFCHFNSDFVSTLPAGWAEAALAGRFDLTAYFEWYRAPRTEQTRLMLDAFDEVVFGIFFRPDGRCAHAEIDGRGDAASVTRFVRDVRGRARVLLYVTPSAGRGDADYWRGAERIRRAGSVQFRTFEEEPLLPIAKLNDGNKAAAFTALLRASRGAQRRLAVQHRLLGWVLRGRARWYRLLGTLSSWRTAGRLRGR